jgi:TolB protein
VDLPKPLRWLNSGAFLRALGPIAGLVLVAAVLYTATSIDRVPPSYHLKLSATSPEDGKALTLTSIDVVFNKAVKPETAQDAFSITPAVIGSFHWQVTTLIFTPSEKLPLATTFKVHVAGGVQDTSGNVQGASQDLTFTTVGKPTVASTTPALAAVSVPVDTTIQIVFDRLMDTNTALAGLTIVPDVHYSASWNGTVLAITPDSPLLFSTTYDVKLGDPAVDTDGTPLSDFETTFTTVGIGLRASAVIPAPNVAGVSVLSPIAVVFDGPIDPASIKDAIRLTPPISGSIKTMTLPDDRTAKVQPTQSASPETPPAASGDNVLVFTPDAPLAATTTYSVALSSGVRRTNGEAASEQSWTFTTGEPPSSAQNQIVFLSNRGGVANVWLMNPDGSNQREVTAELVPVNGFDISGDGNTVAYAAAGQVKRMRIDGQNAQVLTAPGTFEYAPTFTPDGTALVVGRRDAAGADLGFWRIPLVSGVDPKQITPDGAPGLGSVALAGEGLTGVPGEPSWAPRAAFSADGKKFLVVRGLDNALELVDVAGTTPPVVLGLTGNSRPIWDQLDGAFYAVATSDKGATWSLWRVSTDGSTARIAPAVGDLSLASDGSLASVGRSADGSAHISFAPTAGSSVSSALTQDSSWSDSSPSFSPDGTLIVFGRYVTNTPKLSEGIWTVTPGGADLKNLATDGAYPRWMP